MDHVIIVKEDEGIVTLTINRPNALNAINQRVMRGLHDFFAEGYTAVKGLQGVIITGAGNKAFVAGADIKEFAHYNVEEGAELSKFGQETFFLIERFHVPVIAAVNGFALGGGCELAMACHIRIASEYAKFGQPEVNLGLIPGYGGTQRLIQLIGKGKAIELLLTADMVSAQEAHKLGLANHVVPAGEEVNLAMEIIRKIGTKGPHAVTQVIKLVNEHFVSNLNAFDQEYAYFGKALGSEECKEGTKAFMEKRKPNFKR